MINGIDVSHWQGDDIDWQTVKVAGYEFAYIKCTDGTTGLDPKFSGNWLLAREAGFLTGAYHFLQPFMIDVQMERFGLMLGRIDSKGALPPCIDVEEKAITAEMVLRCVETFPNCVIYTNQSWIRDNLISSPACKEIVSGSRLWVADYLNSAEPRYLPWATWTFWQHSAEGKIPGIKGDVDLDYFNGTIEQLKSLTGDGLPNSEPGLPGVSK